MKNTFSIVLSFLILGLNAVCAQSNLLNAKVPQEVGPIERATNFSK